MPSLIVLFNLRDSSARAAYEHWAQTTDVPTVKGLASVDDFRVYRLDGLMGKDDEAPPYEYCEVIEVNDMEGLGRDVSSETMQRVAAEFQGFADNPIFIVADQFA